MEYNDSSVYPLSESSLVRDTAYVLFYQRRSRKLRTDELIQRVERESALLKQKKVEMPVTVDKTFSTMSDSSSMEEVQTTDKSKEMDAMDVETTEAKEEEDLYGI